MLKVAIVFTIGCSVLVCNAVLSALPLIFGRQWTLPASCIYVEGILSVLSCTIFLVGSVFAFVEAWKLDSESPPGFVQQLQGVPYLESDDGLPEYSEHDPRAGMPAAHVLTGNSSHEDLFKHFRELPSEKEGLALKEGSKSSGKTQPRIKAPGNHSRYLELGIFASTIFLCSSALYFATSIASLITIIHHGTIDRCIRYPQLLAAAGFAIASLLLIIKVQRDSKGPWWLLKVWSPSLHVNFWNLVGSTGFIFCACFGLLEHASWAQEQFGYSYLWGSWAFLLGSVFQWYRSLQRKHRVAKWTLEKSPV